MSPVADIPDLESQGHYPSADRRGYKADIWDGGHRIPFIARWPGKIKPGTRNDQLICLTDLMATCADILGAKLPDNAGEDSVSILPALLGEANKPIHEAVVHHSINGSFAIRQGQWKLELCPSSGGWSAPKPGSEEAKHLPPIQLYDMSKDVGERTQRIQDPPGNRRATDEFVGEVRCRRPYHSRDAAEERRRHQALEGRASRRRNTSKARRLKVSSCFTGKKLGLSVRCLT